MNHGYEKYNGTQKSEINNNRYIDKINRYCNYIALSKQQPTTAIMAIS
jgi:hypothetical protein